MPAQLVYTSSRISSSEKDIESILEASKRNNPSLDITGVLLYSDTKFIQLVEGDARTILNLYDKIKTDTRHKNIRTISLRPIQERAFPSWHMGSKKFYTNEVDFETNISDEDKEVFKELLSGKEQDGLKALNLVLKMVKPTKKQDKLGNKAPNPQKNIVPKKPKVSNKFENHIEFQEIKALNDISPEFAKYAQSILEDNVYNRKILDETTKNIIGVVALTLLGNSENQLKFYLKRSLENGVSKEKIAEIMILLSTYSGLTTATNGMNVLKKVLSE